MLENEFIGANPDLLFPCEKLAHVCFLKNAITHPNIVVGDFTYYNDLNNKPADFQKNNVLYIEEFCQDKLIIGKYCAIASGAKFLMNACNHKLKAFTGYPFQVFNANGWGNGERTKDDIHFKGDLVIENDVWIGYEAIVLPGAKICNGAIIGARTVVAGTIPPYAIAVGNPARVIRMRFDEETINLLLEIKWWDWDAQKIADNLEILTNCNLDDLRKLKEV